MKRVHFALSLCLPLKHSLYLTLITAMPFINSAYEFSSMLPLYFQFFPFISLFLLLLCA